MVLDVHEGMVGPGKARTGLDGLAQGGSLVAAGGASLVLGTASARRHHDPVKGVPSHKVPCQDGVPGATKVIGGLGMDHMGQEEGAGDYRVRVDPRL
jgi:hypothetical protein